MEIQQTVNDSTLKVQAYYPFMENDEVIRENGRVTPVTTQVIQLVRSKYGKEFAKLFGFATTNMKYDKEELNITPPSDVPCTEVSSDIRSGELLVKGSERQVNQAQMQIYEGTSRIREDYVDAQMKPIKTGSLRQERQEAYVTKYRLDNLNANLKKKEVQELYDSAKFTTVEDYLSQQIVGMFNVEDNSD